MYKNIIFKSFLIGLISGLVSVMFLLAGLGVIIYAQYIIFFPIYIYLLVRIVRKNNTDFRAKFLSGTLFSLFLGVGYGFFFFVLMQVSPIEAFEVWDDGLDAWRVGNKEELAYFSAGFYILNLFFNGVFGSIFSVIVASIVKDKERESLS